MKNDISSYYESKDGYMMPVFVQNPYRPEQLIEKYKLTKIKYEKERKGEKCSDSQ